MIKSEQDVRKAGGGGVSVSFSPDFQSQMVNLYLTLSIRCSASFFCPDTDKNNKLSGMIGEKQMKKINGITEIPTRYLQPSVGMMAQANKASRQAPKAQKKDMTMMARPRTAVGRNSA